MKKIFIMLMMVIYISSCSDTHIPDDPTPPEDNPTYGVEKFDISIPHFARFEELLDMENIMIHMRGKENLQDYYVNIEIKKNESEYKLSSVNEEDLSNIPYQKYYISQFIIPSKSGEQRVIPVEAAITIVNKDSMRLTSSINLTDESFGSGAEDDEYIISDEASLNSKFLDVLDSGNSLSGVSFVQSTNINLTESRESCAGDSETLFMGSYDGLNNSISFLNISTYFYGALLYGIGDTGSVSNLTLASVDITSYCNSAALACTLNGGTIYNVSVNGNISCRDTAGSIVSEGWGTITKCSSHAIITAMSDADGGFGGIAGYIKNSDDNNSIIISDCSFSGEIYGDEGDNIGGIVGALVNGNNSIINCCVSGKIEGNDDVGGLIGSLLSFKNATITNCMVGVSLVDYYYMQEYSPMDITISGDLGVGGLIGSIRGATDLYGNFSYDNIVTITGSMFGYDGSNGDYDFIVEGKTYTGGLAGSCDAAIMKNSDFVNYGEIRGIYKSSSNYSKYTGGVFGNLGNGDYSGSKFTNWGTIKGIYSTGGVIGMVTLENDDILGDNPIFENYGYVDAITLNTGKYSSTGGVIGQYSHTVVEGKTYPAPNITAINNANVDGCQYVGGIIGFGHGFPQLSAESGVGLTASSSVTINGTHQVGGAAGNLDFEIENIHSDATFDYSIIATINGVDYVGGHIGEMKTEEGVEFKVELNNTSKVSINASSNYSGGIIGYVEMNPSSKLTIKSYDKMGDSSLASKGSYTGGIIGNSHYNSYSSSSSYKEKPKIIIENCYNTINISTGTSGSGSYFGGIMASSEVDVSISKSCNLGNISATGDNVGGIMAHSSNGISISECYNSGTISGVNNRGGIVGYISSYTPISDCFNMGEVTSGGTNVAGIVGKALYSENVNMVSISNCYNCGTTGYGILGGESSLSDDEVNISNCYYLNTASNGNIGIKNETASQVDDNYLKNNLRFSTSVWSYGNGGYPYLTNVKKYINYPGK